VRGVPAQGRRLTKIQVKEVQLFWDRFFTSETYRENVKERILNGKAPHMEVLGHHMTYGKPKETLAFEAPGDGIFVLQIGGTIVKAQALEDGTVKTLSQKQLPARTEADGPATDA